MSTKKPSKLHLDHDGARFNLLGKTNKGKTFVRRKGRYITTKELKRREFQRSKSLGANGVKSSYVAEINDRPVQVNRLPNKSIKEKKQSLWLTRFLYTIFSGLKKFAKYLYGR